MATSSTVHGRTGARPGTARPRTDRITGTELVGFTTLAYGFMLVWLVPLIAGDAVVIPGRGWPTHLPALLAPLLAALLMTWRASGWPGVRDLLARMGRWRIGIGWWVVVVSPPLVLGVTLAAMRAAGQPLPPPADFARFSGISATVGVVGMALIVTLVNAFGEEVGWRGYALPRLQRRYGPLPATLILTAVIAVWHVPYFFVLDTYQAMNPPMVVLFVVGLAGGALVFTWLYNGTGGSLLAVTVWHGLYNATGATVAATSGAGIVSAVIWTAVVMLAVTLVVLELRAQRRGGPSVLGPPQTD